MMKIEYPPDLDIKALSIYIIAIVGVWFGRIDWIIAVLFCLTTITFTYHFKKKSKEAKEIEVTK